MTLERPPAVILDGRAAAKKVLEKVQAAVKRLKSRGITPALATVLVGEDPASAVYVGQKIKACQAQGLSSVHVPLPGRASQEEVLHVIRQLNQDSSVHGILLQLPLPHSLRAEPLLWELDPAKDADGLHPSNQGRWMAMKSLAEVLRSGLPLPCTPAGVMELFRQYEVPLAGAQAVVLGRSSLVGKPLAALLLAADATVTQCHSRSAHVSEYCRQADILIAALGKPHFVKADMVKRGAVVIDVGISRTPQGLMGDVDFTAAQEVAGLLTPVPGGVGPMTVACLLWNTVQLAARRADLALDDILQGGRSNEG